MPAPEATESQSPQHDKRRCGKTRIAATSKLQEVLLVVKVQMDDAVVVSLLTPVDDARPVSYTHLTLPTIYSV